jgi:hypothetical protein
VSSLDVEIARDPRKAGLQLARDRAVRLPRRLLPEGRSALPKACDAKAQADDPMDVFQSRHDLRMAIYRRDLGDAEPERILAAERR